MSDWTPLPGPGTGQGRTLTDSVRLSADRILYVSRDLVAKAGSPSHVVACRNGRAAVVGLKPVVKAPRLHALKIGTSGAVSAFNILTQIGKEPPKHMTELPHHWDDDVLVLDLSGLPDATGGRS